MWGDLAFSSPSNGFRDRDNESWFYLPSHDRFLIFKLCKDIGYELIPVKRDNGDQIFIGENGKEAVEPNYHGDCFCATWSRKQIFWNIGRVKQFLKINQQWGGAKKHPWSESNNLGEAKKVLENLLIWLEKTNSEVIYMDSIQEDHLLPGFCELPEFNAQIGSKHKNGLFG